MSTTRLNLRQYHYCCNTLVLNAPCSEKISQTSSTMGSVPRLLVPSANFWDEATHGVAPRGKVYTTMFPMPSLSGCAFNRSLWQAIGDVAGAEGRAATNIGAANDVFWAPNVREVAPRMCWQLSPPSSRCIPRQVNLVRDPRCEQGA